MNHGIVDVFAYQEALLIEAVFGVALLTMLWIGFRRWLQHKEKMSWLIADQAAEHSAQHGAQMERIEARLNVIEQNMVEGAVKPDPQIDPPRAKPLPDANLKRDEV